MTLVWDKILVWKVSGGGEFTESIDKVGGIGTADFSAKAIEIIPASNGMKTIRHRFSTMVSASISRKWLVLFLWKESGFLYPMIKAPDTGIAGVESCVKSGVYRNGFLEGTMIAAEKYR